MKRNTKNKKALDSKIKLRGKLNQQQRKNTTKTTEKKNQQCFLYSRSLFNSHSLLNSFQVMKFPANTDIFSHKLSKRLLQYIRNITVSWALYAFALFVMDSQSIIAGVNGKGLSQSNQKKKTVSVFTFCMLVVCKCFGGITQPVYTPVTAPEGVVNGETIFILISRFVISLGFIM